MFDFDPRDYDSRDDERHGSTPNRGNRGASDDRDRDDDWRQPEVRVRDRDDARWAERDHDPSGLASRDVFMRDLDLLRGPEREIVHDARDREYSLRGSETRTLSTIGAFRVVSTRDLPCWRHARR